MRAEVMSAGWLGAMGIRRSAERDQATAVQKVVRLEDRIASEQVRNLVQRVFCGSTDPAVKQVIFAPMDAQTAVNDICRKVGETLALESHQAVAVVACERTDLWKRDPDCDRVGSHESFRTPTSRVRSNLWVFPGTWEPGGSSSATSVRDYLGKLRREFEYSIVAAPSCAESNQALNMTQVADGMILVISALYTRRAAARRIREALRDGRVLGTVLRDREFPIPEAIYRRL